MEQDVRTAFHALVEVRREMMPLFEFPDDKTEAKKEEQKQKLLEYKEILKAKKSVAVAEAQKGYKLFRCFVVGESQTQWDKIVHKMHSKNPWISMNGKSNQGPCVCSWLSFQDCIKLHKLILVPADATGKQRFYIQQTIKKPPQVRIHQYMACMGVLNDYLAFLPMVYNSSMAIEGTKKGNVPFDEADLSRIVLNLVPV
jgi:hypothetical protein